jgi:hypothetical protein
MNEIPNAWNAGAAPTMRAMMMLARSTSTTDAQIHAEPPNSPFPSRPGCAAACALPAVSAPFAIVDLAFAPIETERRREG